MDGNNMKYVHKQVNRTNGQKDTALGKITKSYFSQNIACELLRLTLEIEPAV
jgi:hypothetical protein